VNVAPPNWLPFLSNGRTDCEENEARFLIATHTRTGGREFLSRSCVVGLTGSWKGGAELLLGSDNW
jgi:hypothetical protein